MCLYAWVLDVGRCADLVPVFFGIGCGVLCRFIFWGIRPAALLVMDCFEAFFCMLRCWLWDAVPIWFLYSSVLDVERCADLFLYIVFFGHWAGCTFASILCSLRLNFQPGMWQRYGLLRRRGDYYLGCGRRRYCGRAQLFEPKASSGPFRNGFSRLTEP